ncbi:hypothetical protein LguiB_027925 [Lonicera macranthoides]
MPILFLKLEPNELYRCSSPIILGDEVMNNHILCVSSLIFLCQKPFEIKAKLCLLELETKKILLD